MTKTSFQAPRLLTIGLGILLFTLLLMALCSLSQGVKWAGSVLLFLPERLGLVQTVHPGDVLPLDMDRSPVSVTFTHAGLYQVYTADYDLLVISDQLAQSDSPPWITVTDTRSGETVAVRHITRGLLPYDTPHAPGRPVIEVVIPKPGDYLLDFPTRQARMAFVPDYVSGHETLMLACFAIQLLILASPLAAFLFRREQRTWHQRLQERARSTEQLEKIRRLSRGQGPHERGSDGRAGQA